MEARPFVLVPCPAEWTPFEACDPAPDGNAMMLVASYFWLVVLVGVLMYSLLV